jgi:hypothetical protein
MGSLVLLKPVLLQLIWFINPLIIAIDAVLFVSSDEKLLLVSTALFTLVNPKVKSAVTFIFELV